MKLRSIVVLLALLAASACSEPLEFADWTIPVLEGTRIIEYAAVPPEQRAERIELVEDLVIGERGDDDNYRLYNAAGAKVDAEGNLLVLDAGNFRVQVFDCDGDYVRTFGGQGQGPGEFTQPRELVLAGDRVVVVDGGNRRFSSWTLDGEPLGDVGIDSRWTPSRLFGFDDGTFLGRFIGRRDEDPSGAYAPRLRLFTFGTDFKQLAAVQEFPPVRLSAITRQTETAFSEMRVMLPSPSSSHAATRRGEIFTSQGEEYQVYAFAQDGTPRWALRVAWERLPTTEGEIVAAMDRARESLPDARRSEVYIPERKPALSSIAVDGHGHLYVFPWPEDLETDERPVDIYSRDGEPVFSGWMPVLRWSDARGDFLYGWESDDETGEERIIRYRLVEPFR